MKLALRTFAAATAFLVFGALVGAAEDSSNQAGTGTAGESQPPAAEQPEAKRELTPEEKAEKEARKACKAKICDIIATRDTRGDNVSCDILKTWREEDISKMLGGKVDWPWGKAVCQSKLELERKALALAMSKESYEIVMPVQKVSCALAQKKGGEPYTVEVTLAPKVKFENGKATEASINWGKADAPLFIYPLIYAGTGLDNKTNVLGPEVVRMVNEFTTKKCAELKVDAGGYRNAQLP
jgi:hypothetical protein